MKHNSISTQALVQALVLTLIVSACGVSPQTAPTIDPLDLQVTAVAAAYTIVAETQAAIPTSTPLPSPTATATNTPNATTTLPHLPTLGATFTPSPVGSGPVDPCINTVLPDKLTGETIKIRIDNPTKATIMVSVNLQSGNPQGVCGFLAQRKAATRYRNNYNLSELVTGKPLEALEAYAPIVIENIRRSPPAYIVQIFRLEDFPELQTFVRDHYALDRDMEFPVPPYRICLYRGR